MRIGNDRRGDDFEINVVPLIDVLLTLLMFFVLTSTFVQHSRMQVTLPNASAQDRDMNAPALTITVDREGRYWVGSDAVPGEGVAVLKQAIERNANGDHDRPIHAVFRPHSDGGVGAIGHDGEISGVVVPLVQDLDPADCWTAIYRNGLSDRARETRCSGAALRLRTIGADIAVEFAVI